MTGLTVLWIGLCAVVALVGTVVASRVRRALATRVDHEHGRAERSAAMQLATLEALALAVEAREYPPRNGRRVQYFAVHLARALGIDGDECDAIATAALLRDIGKLVVPEHILSKPGPLTPAELEKVRCHPRAGADLIGAVPFPWPVAPIIESHHERWDGSGYPTGLRGEEIPRGARVLAVVDQYDALVSARPYHVAAPAEAAVHVLRQEAGHSLDPVVVDTFLRILPTLSWEDARLGRGAASAQPEVEARAAIDARATVLDDISLAHHELDALYEISRSMGTTIGLDDTMTLIASKLSNLVPFVACALYVPEEVGGRLRSVFAVGLDAELLRALGFEHGSGHVGWVARHRAPLLDVAPGSDMTAGGVAVPSALRSALMHPLVTDDTLVGVLGLYHTTPGFYTRDHRRVTERVCDQASAVIRNALVFDRTKAASQTDALTGLPNRRMLQAHVTAELARAERTRGTFALFVLDVDHFKTINDTSGHHAGDRALQRIAAALASVVRSYDMCARFAGDEFVVIMTGCGPEEAERKQRELQAAVAALNRPADRLPLSVSVGAACYPGDGADFETLVGAADGRMYADKAAQKLAQPSVVRR